jgi:hypothetical protein
MSATTKGIDEAIRTGETIHQLMDEDVEIDCLIRTRAKEIRMLVYRICDLVNMPYPDIRGGQMGGVAGYIASIPLIMDEEEDEE